jgi:threonine dehydrogenase-like Zn-dependent dehydrogenase
MCPDIMSTGFAGAVAAKIRIGDIGAVFAQGPIGLCATVTAGARLRGAGMIIAVDAVDAVDERLAMAMSLGADVTLDFRKVDVVAEILKLTGGVASMHPGPLVTHRYALDDIVQAYELFSHQSDGVLKVAIQTA